MKRTKLTTTARLVAALTVAGALLAGASAGASTHAAKPTKGGTLTYLKNAEQGNGWDPGQMLGVPTNSEVPGGFAMYDVLLWDNPDTGKLVGRLATGVTTNDAGLTWTVKLRSGVKFSDGSAFDAAAVQYNWQRLADPNTRPAPLRQPSQVAKQVASYQVVDPATLKVTLTSPDPVFDKKVAYNLSSIASPTALNALGTGYGTKPVGAGPFVLKEWVRDVQQVYVRNDAFWEKGKPYLDGITVKFVQDDQQRLNTVQTGGGNVGIFFDPTYAALAQQAGLEAATMSMTGGGWGMAYNNSKAPFNDVRMRQALSLAIDRKQFNDTRRPGNPSSVINTVHRPGSTFFDASEKFPKFDLDGAQKLIDSYVAEKGGAPVSFTLLAFNTPYIQTDGQQILGQLQKLKNIDVKLDVAASATVIARYTVGDYQLIWQGIRWEDPAIEMVNSYASFGSNNTTRYNNPAVDVLARQLLVETDLKKKKDLTHQIVTHVQKDVPNFWVTGYISTTVVDKTVKGWNMYFDSRPVLTEVWLGKPNT